MRILLAEGDPVVRTSAPPRFSVTSASFAHRLEHGDAGRCASLAGLVRSDREAPDQMRILLAEGDAAVRTSAPPHFSVTSAFFARRSEHGDAGWPTPLARSSFLVFLRVDSPRLRVSAPEAIHLSLVRPDPEAPH